MLEQYLIALVAVHTCTIRTCIHFGEIKISTPYSNLLVKCIPVVPVLHKWTAIINLSYVTVHFIVIFKSQ